MATFMAQSMRSTASPTRTMPLPITLAVMPPWLFAFNIGRHERSRRRITSRAAGAAHETRNGEQRGSHRSEYPRYPESLQRQR